MATQEPLASAWPKVDEAFAVFDDEVSAHVVACELDAECAQRLSTVFSVACSFGFTPL